MGTRKGNDKIPPSTILWMRIKHIPNGLKDK